MMGHRLRYPFVRVAGAFKSIDPADNYLVFAEPRGGSTWLTEIVHMIPRTAIIWEPLNARAYPELARLRLWVRQHVPENARWPELELFISQILRGRKLSYHTTSHTTPSELLRARRLIVKFCRGNALMPWLLRRFPVRNTPVYLVRHPFAVVASQLRHGAWSAEPAQFNIPESKFCEVYEPHRRFLAQLNSVEEVLTARWCLANKDNLRSQDADRRWLTVFYEALMEEPIPELERIFSVWGLPLPHDLEKSVRVPSRTVRSASKLEEGRAQLGKWRKTLSVPAQGRMQRVLDHFEVHTYSQRSVSPDLVHP